MLRNKNNGQPLNVLSTIKNQIGSGKTEEAIDSLVSYLELNQSHWVKDAYLISNNFKRSKLDEANGIINSSNFHTKAANAMLEIIKDLETGTNEDKNRGFEENAYTEKELIKKVLTTVSVSILSSFLIYFFIGSLLISVAFGIIIGILLTLKGY